MPIFNKEQEVIGQSIIFTCTFSHAPLISLDHGTGVVKLTNKLNNTPFDASDEEVFQVGIKAYLIPITQYRGAVYIGML